MERAPRVTGFDLIQPLGGGPFTRVWSAHDHYTDAMVAIKLLREDGSHREIGLELLRREGRAGLSAIHPHLVRVRANHTVSPPHYLTMDLLGGELLRSVLRRRLQLRPATALWIARQMAEALAALHRAGYAHGDVKPENVRLTDSHNAVLIDLGYACKPGENAKYLRDGLILGTASYMAPEVCAADPNAGDKADIFSLGVMLFEMLTGKLPYPAGTAVQTMEAHRTLAATDLRQEPGPWPRKLPDLLARLLSHFPMRRPPAAALAPELMALEIAALRAA